MLAVIYSCRACSCHETENGNAWIGQLLVLINTKASTQMVHVPSAHGKHAATIDGAVGNEPAREGTLGGDTIQLSAFATMLIHWRNASASR
jgi:hypothetical protein